MPSDEEYERLAGLLDAATGALRKYGQHRDLCAVAGGYERRSCDCGLAAVLGRIDGETGK